MWGFRSKRANRRPEDGVRVYAIGDIHGCVELLDQAYAKIDADEWSQPSRAHVEIHLGDYIDRGPASRDVLDRMIARSKRRQCVFLKGNHEACAIEFLDHPEVFGNWSQFGALQTLISYGLQPPLNASPEQERELARAFGDVLPPAHRAFLQDLQLSFVSGDFFFAHAGIRPGIPLDQQREQDLIWIRAEFLLCEDDFEKIVVHGHTPVPEPDFRANRINIDTGAFATGRLTCLRIEGDACDVL